MGRMVRVPSIGPRAGEERPQERPETRDDERRRMHWGPGGPWFVGLVMVAIAGAIVAAFSGAPIPPGLWAAVIVLIIGTFVGSIWRTYRREGMTRTTVASIIHLAALLVLIASFHVGLGPAKDILWAIALIGFVIAWAVVNRRI